MNIVSLILNIIHFILVFIPIIIFFVPKKVLHPLFPYIFLIIILIPLHWPLNDNECVFTTATKKSGNLQNSETTSQFSEKYLRWLYEPIMNLLGLKWNSDNLEKMVYYHWILNFILVWYYNTYKYKCK